MVVWLVFIITMFYKTKCSVINVNCVDPDHTSFFLCVCFFLFVSKYYFISNGACIINAKQEKAFVEQINTEVI